MPSTLLQPYVHALVLLLSDTRLNRLELMKLLTTTDADADAAAADAVVVVVDRQHHDHEDAQQFAL